MTYVMLYKEKQVHGDPIHGDPMYWITMIGRIYLGELGNVWKLRSRIQYVVHSLENRHAKRQGITICDLIIT